MEVLLESEWLDNAGMVYDFGLMKRGIKTLIDGFDHATTIWAGDDSEYIAAVKQFSKRWVSVPVNPSAEQFCRIFFVLIDELLSLSVMNNGERGVQVQSIIVHETDTGYAQCFRKDAYNANMGVIKPADIVFSPEIIASWDEPELLEWIVQKREIVNPTDV